MARRPSFRRGHDDLGLRRALGDGLLPVLVGAMAFLAALAGAGGVAAAALAQHWQEGASAAITVQVPQPGDKAKNAPTRRDAVAAALSATDALSVHALSEGELNDLLRPWLGSDAEKLSLPLPAVFAVHLESGSADLGELAAKLQGVAPGTLIEQHDIWQRRLAVLARSMQACAALVLLIVGGVAVSVIAVATRAGLAARREAIEIVHLLGATDSYVAGRFAARATWLAGLGGAVGAVMALPVLMVLARVAAPLGLVPQGTAPGDMLPAGLWAMIPALPLGAAVIGWLTAQGTVRRWLRRLP
jgi:cell division transport system permease protein